MSVFELFSLTGHVAVVTGAGSGLGRAMAEAAADAGGVVVCADLNEAAADETTRAIAAHDGVSSAAHVDVCDEDSVAAMVATTVERHGSLDVIFCNAGISGYYDRIDNVDIQQWSKVLAVNLTGAMLCAKHAAKVMIAQNRGKIIFTASIWGLIGSDSVPIPDYAASKGAVVNLTRELALELAPFGITVNALAPGFFDTSIGRDKAVDPGVKEVLRAASLELIPTHRRATPDEIKGAALFLASRASDMVSGHTLVVDGGCVAR